MSMKIHFKKDNIALVSLRSSVTSSGNPDGNTVVITLSVMSFVLRPQHQFEILQAQRDRWLSAAIGV